MKVNLKNIAEIFQVHGKVLNITPFGDGLINDTYLVECSECNYILQRINHNIFKNIPALSNNKTLVTSHIAKKYDPDKTLTIKFIQTNEGEYYLRDSKSDYWQMSVFIKNSKTFNKITSSNIAYEGGKAIGLFQYMISDISPKELYDTIPDFHNTEKRFHQLYKSIDSDIENRVSEVKDEIELIKTSEKEIVKVSREIENNIIPKRIVHNDTKISNVLFDQNDKAICMIDLDTVMAGSVLHDFGDAIRSGCNTGDEDDKDLNNGSLDIYLFEAFAKGYLEEAKKFLTKIEIDNLAFSAKLITMEQAIRFLTDYLDGDKYYKIKYASHNLDRAKAQLKLCQSIENQMDTMKSIVSKYI